MCLILRRNLPQTAFFLGISCAALALFTSSMLLFCPALQVPEGIRKHLAPFQKQGVEFVLKKDGRAMIADEMGLGKTIQVPKCVFLDTLYYPTRIILSCSVWCIVGACSPHWVLAVYVPTHVWELCALSCCLCPCLQWEKCFVSFEYTRHHLFPGPHDRPFPALLRTSQNGRCSSFAPALRVITGNTSCLSGLTKIASPRSRFRL